MDYYNSSMWSNHEGFDDLKQRILYAKIELESAKMEAKEQIHKTEEDLRNLFDLVKLAQKERDEARDLLQKLLHKTMPSSPIDAPYVLHQSPLLLPAIANSSISESNSLSETYYHQSSTVDSFFNAVSSPDLSKINVADSSNLAYNRYVPNSHAVSSKMNKRCKIDESSIVIDSIAKGKLLPHKGKLLQAVMEVGPLLQTLLFAGPLPRWRNPPPPLQSFKIPPFSSKGFETACSMHNKQVSNCSYMSLEPVNSFAAHDMLGGFLQSCSSSVLNFGESCSNTRLNSDKLVASSSCLNIQAPFGKRQRLLWNK